MPPYQAFWTASSKSQNFSTGFAGGLSLRSRFDALAFALPFSAHASPLIALYALTLSARTILPRKARREPTYVYVYEAT